MSTWKFVVNSVDISVHVLQTSFTADLVLMHRGDVVKFIVFDQHRTMSFSDLMPVQVYDPAGNQKFGGLIQQHRISAPTAYATYWLITAIDFTWKLQRTLVNKKYTNQTVDTIVKDLVSTYALGFTTNNVQSMLALLPSFSETHGYLSNALDKLARLGSIGVYLMWDVDINQDIHFYDSSHCPGADVSLVDTAPTAGQINYLRDSFYYQSDSSQLVTQVTVTGGVYLSPPYEDLFVGDGTTAAWLLTYVPDTDTTNNGYIPNVLLNGVAQTVALDSHTGFGSNQCLISIDTVSQTAAVQFATAPAASAVIRVDYVYNIPIVTTMQDPTAVSSFGTWEEVIADSSLVTQTVAARRALGELGQFGRPITNAHADLDKSYVGTLAPGQILTLVSSELGITSQMIVQRLRLTGLGGGIVRHTVDLVGQPS